MRKYEWKPGRRIKGDPMLVGRELDRLSRLNGKQLSPAIIVEEARRATSALHQCFEWDDGLAAEKYRIVQARQVLHSIVKIEHEGRAMPMFVNIQPISTAPADDARRAYVPMDVVLQDGRLTRLLMDQAIGDLRAYQTRYRVFEQLTSPVQSAIDVIKALTVEEPIEAGV